MQVFPELFIRNRNIYGTQMTLITRIFADYYFVDHHKQIYDFFLRKSVSSALSMFHEEL